jgi:hypothetical protein
VRRKSMRSLIYEAHQRNPQAKVKDIALEVGCSADYVYTCLSQFGLSVGSAFSDREHRSRNRHNLTDPFRSKCEPNHTCRKIHYRDGALAECGAPSDGRTYCKCCRAEMSGSFLGPNYHEANLFIHQRAVRIAA